jgi:hypothetical protein
LKRASQNFGDDSQEAKQFGCFCAVSYLPVMFGEEIEVLQESHRHVQLQCPEDFARGDCKQFLIFACTDQISYLICLLDRICKHAISDLLLLWGAGTAAGCSMFRGSFGLRHRQAVALGLLRSRWNNHCPCYQMWILVPGWLVMIFEFCDEDCK